MFGKKKNQQAIEQKEIGLKKFLYQTVSELWSYELWSYLIIFFIINILKNIAKALLLTRDDAITTSNLIYVLFSPQGLLIIIIAIIVVVTYIVVEISGEIIFIGDIIENKKRGSIVYKVYSAILEGFKSLRLFLNPLGIVCLLYVFIISPIVGVGFTISMTDEFYIPNFIMDVILSNKFYGIPFMMLMLALAVLGIMHMFTFHGVLLSKKTPREVMRESRLIIKHYWRSLFFRIVRVLVVLSLIRLVFYLLFNVFTMDMLAELNNKIPDGHVLHADELLSDTNNINTLDLKVFFIRSFTVFAIFGSRFIELIVKIICDSFFMICITRYYLEFSHELSRGTALVYWEQKRLIRYSFKIIGCIIFMFVIVVVSFLIGYNSENIVRNDKDTKIIVHRAGGFLASENSIDGLNVSIENNCFGAETDIQRTKDGHYIINHDDNFLRLTGNPNAPKDLTLAEIRELQIEDTTGTGKILQVPTLEEFLDVIKGKIKLFIELKGVTADKQMVDDVVRIVKEKSCENDVVLISLKYDIMYYAEEQYPEMDTGLLFFAGFGDVVNMHVDYILMEEEIAEEYVDSVEDQGKVSGVWTVNTDRGMVKAFDIGADTVITDDLNLYYRVKNRMKLRTDYEVLRDWCLDIVEDK